MAATIVCGPPVPMEIEIGALETVGHGLWAVCWGRLGTRNAGSSMDWQNELALLEQLRDCGIQLLRDGLAPSFCTDGLAGTTADLLSTMMTVPERLPIRAVPPSARQRHSMSGRRQSRACGRRT